MARKRHQNAETEKNGATAEQAMYFLSLTLSNIRCFGDEPQTLDLSDGKGRPARWTILLGENGTGKTTVLQSLAWLVPPEDDSPFGFSRSLLGMQSELFP